jgi:hypothetical protein
MRKLPAVLQCIVLFALGTAGCAGQSDTIIDYQRTGGLAGLNESRHITIDGTITRPKTGGGTETATLDPTTVDDLERRLEAADFPTLAPAYGCGGCPDVIVYTLLVPADRTTGRTAGRITNRATYRVTAYDSGELPAQLRPLIAALGAISERSLDWH